MTSEFNQNGKISLSDGDIARKDRLNIYDNLPPQLKKIFQDCPFDASFNKAGLNYLRQYGVKKTLKLSKEQLNNVIRNSCAQTYGQDHPQIMGNFYDL